MIYRAVIQPLAVEDICAAATWYEEQAPGLGEDLTAEIVRAIRRAQTSPELFPILRQRDKLRRVLTERFPYRVFFSVHGDTVQFHAVLHGAQSDYPRRK